MVATGVGGSKAGSEEEMEVAAEREEEAAEEAEEVVVVVVVEVTDPVRMATTLPLLLPSHIGEPDCPCVDLQLWTPMFEHAEAETEHSSICANAASVPPMLKKKEEPFSSKLDAASGEQLLVHIERLGAKPVG